MLHIVVSILSLLLASAILLFGIGLQGTLIALRAGVEGFAVDTTGLIMAAYFIGYVGGTYICPWLIRQFGHIRSYAILATIASAAAVAFPLFTIPTIWFLLRMITGVCMVGLFMVIESWLNEIAPAENRGRFFAVYMLTTLLAMALGQFLLLAGDIDKFDLFAVTTILVSLALVPVAMTKVRQPEPIESPPLHFTTLYKNSPLGVIGTLVAGMVTGAFWGMGPIFASGIGMSELNIALFISLTVIGGALLQWPVGMLSDRYDRRSVLTISALLGGGVALLMHSLLESFPGNLVPLGGGFIFGAFAFSLYALSVAHVNDRLEAGQALDGARGLLQLYGIGAAIGPMLAGYIMQYYGAASLLLFFAVCMLLFGLFALIRMRMSDAIPAEEQGEYQPMQQASPVVLEMDPRVETDISIEMPSTNDEARPDTDENLHRRTSDTRV
jgi:MFS family permease